MWFKCNKAGVSHYVLVLSRVMNSKQRMIPFNMPKESNSSVICPSPLGCYVLFHQFNDEMKLNSFIYTYQLAQTLCDWKCSQDEEIKFFHALPHFSPSWKARWPDPAMTSSAHTSGKKLSHPLQDISTRSAFSHV